MKRIKGWIVALLCASIACLLYFSGIFLGFDNTLQDALYQRIRPIDSAIYLIGIDEPSLASYGPWGTWPRTVFADLLQTLNANEQAKPAVIGIDVMFFGDGNPDADAQLAQAAKEAGNVVCASMIKYTSKLVKTQTGSLEIDDSYIETVQHPYDGLKEVTDQGHINTQADLDGIVRHSIHQAQFEGQLSDSFAYKLYQLYAKTCGLEETLAVPLDETGRFLIPFAGKAGAFDERIGVADVLEGRIDPAIFRDSIVIIGPYEAGMQDAYYTAIDKSTPMYGVEIHANVLQALLEQKYKQPLPFAWQAGLLFAVVFLGYFAFKRFDIKLASAVLVCAILAYLGLAVVLYQCSYSMSVLYIPLCLLILFLFRLGINYLFERKRRKSITDTFKKYVAPSIVDDILQKGDLDLQLGGTKRHIAVLFVDIRGFTPMSESLEAEQVVEILNEYLTLTTKAIFANGGTVDKFIGDATMALFNAPFDQEDYVFRAAKTALDIAAGAKALEQMLLERFGKGVGFGMGIHCGDAVVGNIGTQYRMDYTAIGDTVNTTARLEANAKSGEILISEQLYEAIKERVVAESVGEIPLKGKSNRVFIYKLIDIQPNKHEVQQ